MIVNPPLFSVVVPAYNRAAVILPTLQSVIMQSYSDWECIVVDDGSDDGVLLERVVAGLSDPRFRYIRRPNGGGGAARNTGVTHARGAYIAFLDSDDFFESNKLKEFSKIVKMRADEAYYSYVKVRRNEDAYWIRPDRPIGENEAVAEYLFVANQFMQTSSLVLSRELALEIQFDPALKRGQDLDLCVRIGHHGVRFEMLEIPLSVWVDESELNRTSRHGDYVEPLAWVEKNKVLMSARAYHGYKATVLAYFMAPARPWTALTFLANGLFKGRVPILVITRQFLRCFLPRSAYRRFVNATIKFLKR